MLRRFTRNLIAMFGGVILVILLLGGSVNAGDDITCAFYGKTAVAQNAENIANNCGLSGGRWNANYNDHFVWCIRVPGSSADYETNARIQQLQKCTGQTSVAGADQRCNSYAIIAVAQNATNQEANCGFSGNRWQSNYGNHYNWCVGVPKENAVNENEARRLQLAACTQ